MNEVYILGGLLIAAGLYISYQWSLISRYRRTLSLATFALEAAYIHITEDKGSEEDTD